MPLAIPWSMGTVCVTCAYTAMAAVISSTPLTSPASRIASHAGGLRTIGRIANTDSLHQRTSMRSDRALVAHVQTVAISFGRRPREFDRLGGPVAYVTRSDTQDTTHMPGEVTLMAESDFHRDLVDRQPPVPEQFRSTVHATADHILVHRYPHRPAKLCFELRHAQARHASDVRQ